MNISVIIPTKNRTVLLERAVKSLLPQLSSRDEVIIVDDGSDFEIRKPLPDNRVRVIRNEVSLGGSASRNVGVRSATNEIVMFLDDDDAWESSKVADQIKLFNDSKVALVFSGRKVVWDSDLTKPFRYIKPKKQHIEKSDLLACNFIGTTSSVAIRKTDFVKSGGFDETLKCFQDYDLWMRILDYGCAKHDGKMNVIYTVFKEKGMQISRSGDGRHEASMEYLLVKYGDNLNRKELKIFRSYLGQVVSKALNSSNPKLAIQYSIRSFIAYPKLTSLKFVVGSVLALFGVVHG
ncbi:glycosyltransferase family 2 protein [Vibrio cyclitrophicus]